MTDDTTPQPTQVQDKAAPIVASEGTKLLIIAGLAAAADHFMHSDLAIGAVIAAGGVLATGIYGVWRRLSTWRVLKGFASLLPDSVAVVGKPR